MTAILVLSALVILFAAPRPAGAANGLKDRTLSPYFFIKSDDSKTDRLPLKSTRADVKIAGVMSDVTITQVYKNEGKNTLEAVYIFPASTRAAIYAMRMTIGERVIEANIMERSQARQTYEQAKKQGKTASLLEQQRPNVFQMNVANILPGDEIKVELRYTELIEPEDKVYEFVFPTVVGPRYSTTPAPGAPDTQKWVENPYLREGKPAPYDFGLSVDLRAGMPISRLTSPSHKISAEYSGKSRAHVTIKNDPQAGTKDFVLRYELSGNRIETGLLLYPGKDENFFLMMMEPPARVKAEAVSPREYIFILDVSGSMRGFPLSVTKSLMKDIISNLRPSDFMNVLLFAGGSSVMSPQHSLPATAANKNKAAAWIESRQGGGGTNILPALKRALALPKTGDVSRIIVIVTDGYVSVEPEVFELIRKNLGRANLFSFGIGRSVNRHIVEGMARVGLGEPFVALNEDDAHKQAARFRRYIESPVLTGIKVAFDGLEAYEVEPAAVPDLFALRPVVVFGKYKGEPSGRVVVTGRTSAGDFKKVIQVKDDMASPQNSALSRLWARRRIMRLSDLNMLRPDDKRGKEVTDLGLKYNLMTAYTSFVAVDKIKRADGRIVTVKQPLPLPEGVSDSAVGQGNRQLSSPRMMYNSLGSKAKESAAAMRPATAPAETEEHKWSKKTGPVTLTIEEVRGDMDRAVMEKALRSRQNIFEACCLKTSQKVRGEVTYRLLIDPYGKVREIRVVTSTLVGGPPAADCLKAALKATRFSPPRQGIVEVFVKVTCR
ncbi:MAG: VIT domain-containing protein [Thermodesulfobacteriota bacterium]|nr:VIT domain-containing protein [Thermodesulfobacteriota bacterium]